METFRRIWQKNIKGELYMGIRKYVPTILQNGKTVWIASTLVCPQLGKKNEFIFKMKFPEAFEHEIKGIHNQKLRGLELRRFKLAKLLGV